MKEANLIIRSARPTDRDFVHSAVPWLVSFDPPEWRPGNEIVGAETRAIEAFFAAPPQGSALLIAEAGDGAALGFAYLERQEDYFTREQHGHISMIAVSAEAQGRGVGSELLRAAEAWAREQGYRRLTLTVFDANRRARAVYEHLGYAPEDGALRQSVVTHRLMGGNQGKPAAVHSSRGHKGWRRHRGRRMRREPCSLA